jgi:hypothetical protein
MNLFTLEPFLDEAVQSASAENLRFSLSNPKDKNLKELVKRAGCIDKGNFLPRWSPSNLVYGDMKYKIRRLPIGASFSSKEVLFHFRCMLFLPTATTRELLKFVAQYESFSKQVLKKKEELVAFGRDDFTSVDSSASVIRIENGKRVIRSVPLLNTDWNWSHIFLFRDQD